MSLSYLFMRSVLKTGLGLMVAVFMTMAPATRAADQLRERILYTSFRPAGMPR